MSNLKRDVHHMSFGNAQLPLKCPSLLFFSQAWSWCCGPPLSLPDVLDRATLAGCMGRAAHNVSGQNIQQQLTGCPWLPSLTSAVAGMQADFTVPSSRESLDNDSAWNEMLRGQVPDLFLQALQSFRQLSLQEADKAMAWVNRWLECIPLPGEVRSFPPPHC